MNKFIKEQLQQITIPITSWDDDTTHIIIKKQGSRSNSSEDFIIGNNYDIIVEDYIINPPPNFTLSSNWNFNTNPPEKELEVEVLQIVGKMLKFKCVGKTTGIEWVGWIPRKSITIV